MQTKIMSIFTRTPLHVGCGSSIGAVDQPVVRERHTGYPVIPGSSIKGVLADLWMEEGKDVERVPKEKNGQESIEYIRIKNGPAYQLFGNNDTRKNNDTDEKPTAEAGALIVGEGKLLAFPVRSAKGGYAWLTSPLALKRFRADAKIKFDIPEPVADSEIVVTSKSILLFDGTSKAVFESFPFSKKDEVTADAVAIKMVEYVSESSVFVEVMSRLAIVSDTVFAYFVTNMCEIANHNRIDDNTGVVVQGALFSQENVPSETLFYAPLTANAALFEIVDKKLKSKEVDEILQIGGDTTTGLGVCSVFTKEVM